MKKIFISQPMKDKTDEQILTERKRAIAEVKKAFQTEEVEIIDSFFKDEPKVKTIPLFYLGKSLELLATADVAYFVNGWNEYRGCKIEHECAEQYSIPTITEN